MRRLHFLLFAGLALAAVITACAVNPVSGERELALLSEAEELKLGRDNDVQIRKQYEVVKNPALQAYVQDVGARLAAKSHRPQLKYTFTVLDSPEVNAFALPGGYIYITRGILAHLNSEAELAAVLGHEIGHVTARHSVRQYSAAVAANIGFTIGSLLVPELGTRAGQSLLNVLGGALLSGYGRDHELEADRLGAEYLARTDYEPRAIIEVLGLLKNQELLEKRIAEREGRQPRVYHGVFASHPSSDERLQQVVGAAEKLRSRSNGRVERDSFLQRIDGLAFGDSEAQGIRRGSSFYHSGLNIALSFPSGWRVDNTPTALRAASPAGDAVMQFETTPRGTAKSPQEYLVATMKLNDLHNGRAFTVSAAPAYSGATRMPTPFGVRDARVGAVFLNQQVYRFLGAARDNGIERLLHDTMLSLHPLRPEERALAQGLRVRLVTAKGGERFAELARRSPLKQEPEAVLRILNDRYPSGEPAAGEQFKIIQ
jgi:predicted Zn-dependent protease